VKRDSDQRPQLVEYYEQFLIDQNIDTFLRIVTCRYMNGTLERILTSGDRMARRSAVLALGRLADYQSNNSLGNALVDRDRGVRTLAEASIRNLWMRVGTPTQRHQLSILVEHIDEKEYEQATRLADQLIQKAPWIAEAWYQRGKAYFHLGNFDATGRDCLQALEINAYHFTAASLMGQAYLLQSNPVYALDSFRQALRLNPNMEEVRAQVIHLQRSLKGE
jgi:tetratricopeptide (TPR) repeat protein